MRTAEPGSFRWRVDTTLPAAYRVVREDISQPLTYQFDPTGSQREHLLTQSTPRDGQLKLDILLLLDATGSMGDEIRQLKENIRRIAQRVIASPSEPELRFAMVTYRDREDEFLTRVEDFSADFQLFEERLRSVRALGGGDYPEDLNQGLDDALNAVTWQRDAIQLIFLIADAPPHLDYGQENHYAASAFAAVERGIKIYPIASSGLDAQGEYVFRQLAQLTGSRFIFLVDDSSGADDDEGAVTQESDLAVSDYTVGSLDEIVIEIIEEEMGHQVAGVE